MIESIGSTPAMNPGANTGMSIGGDASNRVGAAGGDFSNVVNIQNNGSVGGSGMQGIEDGGASSGVNNNFSSLEVNQSSFSMSSEINISIEQNVTNIGINFGNPEETMDKMFEMFGGKGQDEKLFELMLAVFEKQQEMIMEIFQSLLEATGMMSAGGAAAGQASGGGGEAASGQASSGGGGGQAAAGGASA